jgi:3-(3-hydroxy-phenyl)propionate hydroxylase
MIVQPRVLLADGQQVLLDDVMGSGFAAVGLGVDPLETMDEPMRRLWARLGARTLKVLPGGQLPRSSTGPCEEIRDDSGLLTRWFEEHRGQIALLRPDRFVVALVSRHEASEGFTTLRSMLGA